MLYACGDMYHRAGQDLDGGLALLLIPAAPRNAYKHLAAAALGVVYVPVVAAAGFECNIRHHNLLARYGCEVAVAGKVLCVGRIGLAYREYHLLLKCGLGVIGGAVLGPYVLCQTECRPRLGPAGIETDMGDDLGDLAARNAVLSCRLEMVCERRVGYTLTYERGDGNQTAVAQPEPVGAAPYLPEEDVVVQFRELRGKFAELLTPGRLFDFLLCHD